MDTRKRATTLLESELQIEDVVHETALCREEYILVARRSNDGNMDNTDVLSRNSVYAANTRFYPIPEHHDCAWAGLLVFFKWRLHAPMTPVWAGRLFLLGEDFWRCPLRWGLSRASPCVPVRHNWPVSWKAVWHSAVPLLAYES